MPKANNTTPEVENTAVSENSDTLVAATSAEYVTDNQADATETSRKLGLLATLVQQSATITWENVGTNGVDGEMFVALRVAPVAYETLRSLVLTLRTEAHNAL